MFLRKALNVPIIDKEINVPGKEESVILDLMWPPAHCTCPFKHGLMTYDCGFPTGEKSISLPAFHTSLRREEVQQMELVLLLSQLFQPRIPVWLYQLFQATPSAHSSSTFYELQID